MGLTYYGSRISPNMTKTPEGYLICMNVPIARTGTQEYLAKELQITDRNPDDIVLVKRTEEEVFDPATIASFEGKPFTDDHPSEDVTTNNYDYYSKGHTQNVHRGTGENVNNLVADIYITNPSVISEIENGKRQISCGYVCDYIDNGDGTYKQARIRGNHIALVDEGRAGANISIKDSKIKERRTHEMGNTISEKIKGVLNLLARSVKDSKSVDDTENMVCDANESIKAMIETPEKKEEKVEVKETCDAMPDNNTALKNALLTASLALNEAIAYLGNGQQETNNIANANKERPIAEANAGQVENTPITPPTEESNAPEKQENGNAEEPINEGNPKTPSSEETEENENDKEIDDELKALDELSEELKDKKEELEDDYEELDEEEDELEDEEEVESEEVPTTDEDDAEVVASEDVVESEGYTKDAMAKFVKDMKPVIAQISNDKERAKVCDAFVKTFKKVTSDSNSLARIMDANDSYARSKVNDSKPFTFEEQQSVFDKLNPHLK